MIRKPGNYLTWFTLKWYTLTLEVLFGATVSQHSCHAVSPFSMQVPTPPQCRCGQKPDDDDGGGGDGDVRPPAPRPSFFPRQSTDRPSQPDFMSHLTSPFSPFPLSLSVCLVSSSEIGLPSVRLPHTRTRLRSGAPFSCLTSIRDESSELFVS